MRIEPFSRARVRSDLDSGRAHAASEHYQKDDPRSIDGTPIDRLLDVQLDTTSEDRTAVRPAGDAMCANAQRSCAPRHEPRRPRSEPDERSEKQSARRTFCPPGRLPSLPNDQRVDYREV